ncbi:5-demethoxyubiquinol-8 5-hydroxylase UbiM [Stakelama sp. CBK3Z-3]|uniref:5-demethoxyubiquinol-8 5-hydroxylase UbiM n=1 Tax=Stakelama flava TaxID=2860338 RepID=A0ABS6XKE5_9SPHN|nr:5-demethoxyubiquinol-8 5-hydroxylase UbiM [Stakelama flava]MBW4330678.1 5-demethoxyubiquinol-8 5-hydroxylase UbiM [Stakelama flava]
MSDEYDVLVVGGGPAGLAFALGLAGSGLRTCVVERQPRAALADPAPDGREIALTHRSVATLRKLGAWDRIAPENIAPLRGARVYNGASPLSLAFDPDGTSADRLGCLVSNHAIRKALYEALADRDDITLMADAPVETVRASRAGVTVTLSGGREIAAKLLVAADSRFSAVRDQLGIAAEVNRLGRSMLVCRVRHSGDHGGIAREWFDHGQTIAMLPLNGNCSSAVLTLTSAAIDRLAALPGPALAYELERRFDHRLGAMELVTGPHVYPLATSYARHFVSDGAALIGDAAVGMHPVTAHGFNLGLQSARTLSGMLTRAARGGHPLASPLLLRRYEARHRLATRPLYAGTNLLVALYTAEHRPARIARAIGLRAARRVTPVNSAITRMLVRQ